MRITQQQLGCALVSAADAEWRKGVRDFDPDQNATPDLIQKYFDETGWHWFLGNYSNGTYTEQWRDKDWQSWCGLFASYCGLQVGNWLYDDRCVDIQLEENVVQDTLPSTHKLSDRSRWNTPPTYPGNLELIPGDVITVGDYNGGAGSHIALVCDRPAGKKVETIEGNAYGQFPDGSRGEGVVRRTRGLEEIYKTYRLTRDHYTGGDLP